MSFPSKNLFRWLLVIGLGCAGAIEGRGQALTFGTLAGNAGYGSVDGVGSQARFDFPRGLAADNAGNVYVADTQNSTIRRLTSNGTLTTVAGTAGSTGTSNGVGTAARFAYPQGV